ncbi:MAG: ThuA domain-containing protein [Capsulimonas sp.]|uniref:ThuA domain-containing protein n=1 Tax=Capsulimonas sp. TaxID=2494211 RepID=UPI00326577AC
MVWKRGIGLIVLMMMWATLAQAAPSKRVLVVTVTHGFRHDVIPTAERILGEIGVRDGEFQIDYARTDEEVAVKTTAVALRAYDAVIFAETTGDLPLPDRQAFLDWIREGHGFVGIHSAADTFHGFTPYLQMLGGEFKQHGDQVRVQCHVADQKFPATVGMGILREVPLEEIYQFQNFEASQVHLLLYLDKHPNDGTPGLYPIAWNRSYGKGRVFYTALGHREDIWSAAWYQNHLQGGIRWALGLAKGDAKPRPLPVIAK